MDFTNLLAVFFPPSCVGCGALAVTLCDACVGVAAPLRFDVGGVSCAAVGRYEGTLRASILLMKKGRRDVGERLGAISAERIGAAFGRGIALVPVPTTRARQRERGFDQAEILSRAVAARVGCVSVGMLGRVGEDVQQGKTRLRRLQAVGRFRMIGGVRYAREKPVVLVDDVATTGTTLRDAAAVLEEAGFSVRGALVAARADA
jgi:predicted amidophosphoribosyltransferase